MRLFNWRSLFVFSLLIFPGLALNAQPKSSSGYNVIKQVKLGGDGGWDALTFDAKATSFTSHARPTPSSMKTRRRSSAWWRT
jgi:hypothetical protein